MSARALTGEATPVPEALSAATKSLSRYGLRPRLDEERFLRRPCDGPHWQLLVDGLDELPNADERRFVLEKLANAIADDPVLYRCVVATRPTAEIELDVLDQRSARSHSGRRITFYSLTRKSAVSRFLAAALSPLVDER